MKVIAGRVTATVRCTLRAQGQRGPGADLRAGLRSCRRCETVATTPSRPTRTRIMRRRIAVALAAGLTLGVFGPLVAAAAEPPDNTDPRVGLAPGYFPWTEAQQQHGAARQRPAGARPSTPRPGNFGFVNSDLAFTGDQRHRRQLQRLPGLRHLQPDQPDAAQRRSSAPAARATCRCTATCSSCPSRRPAAGSTAAPRALPAR